MLENGNGVFEDNACVSISELIFKQVGKRQLPVCFGDGTLFFPYPLSIFAFGYTDGPKLTALSSLYGNTLRTFPTQWRDI